VQLEQDAVERPGRSQAGDELLGQVVEGVGGDDAGGRRLGEDGRDGLEVLRRRRVEEAAQDRLRPGERVDQVVRTVYPAPLEQRQASPNTSKLAWSVIWR